MRCSDEQWILTSGATRRAGAAVNDQGHIAFDTVVCFRTALLGGLLRCTGSAHSFSSPQQPGVEVHEHVLIVCYVEPVPQAFTLGTSIFALNYAMGQSESEADFEWYS